MSCEIPSVFNQRTVRGRKEYRCCECSRAIPKGGEHEIATGLWAGEWGRFRTCQPCKAVRDKCRDYAAYDDEQPWFCGLREWIENCGEIEILSALNRDGVSTDHLFTKETTDD